MRFSALGISGADSELQLIRLKRSRDHAFFVLRKHGTAR